MELAHLQEKGIAPKTYKHFSVKSAPSTTENTGADHKEFFYIGSNTAIIDNLIAFFDSGYAAEHVNNAILILKRIIEKRTSCPDVIFIDGGVGKTQLTKLQEFLSSTQSLVTTPLFVESSGVTEKELAGLRRLHFIDEIISLPSCDYDMVISKIGLIKKIKGNQIQEQLHQKMSQPDYYLRGKSYLIKRGFDILLSLLLFITLAPLFLLIAIAIKLESRGPVFYVSKRAGRGYRIFDFYQFRTMEMGADKKVEQLSHLNQYAANTEHGPVFFKVSNDPRITRLGAFLRNSSLDELPQLINVLLGDMSLVGNRPLPLYEAETLTTDEWARRFMAPAGITGLWQIKKRGHKDMSVEDRICLDIAYANRNTFMYDLWIMANTPPALIQKSNV